MRDTVYSERLAIRSVYRSLTWEYKVDKMKPSQVIAIYVSFKKRGLLK